MIFNKIKKLFSYDDIDLSRRRFIKTGAQLATLAVVASATPLIFKLKTKEIEEQILGGIIENQTFYIDKTVIIDIPNVIIRNCRFIVTAPMDYAIEFGKNAKNLHINDCFFDCSKMVNEATIKINPQNGDMTRTFQSAIDTAPNIKLEAGVYRVNQPVLMTDNFNITGARNPLEGRKTKAYNIVKSILV